MALLENSFETARQEGSGYERLVGNPQLARLLSAVQGATIVSGNELEKMICELAPTVSDLDAYLQADIIPMGAVIANKRQVKKSKILDSPAEEPDFLIFSRTGREQRCRIVELKDGDQFDTKKTSAERASLLKFQADISRHIQFVTSIHICFFNAATREQVVNGFKRKITEEEALTGREFCELTSIDYDSIVEVRSRDHPQNFEFFAATIAGIPELVARIDELRR